VVPGSGIGNEATHEINFRIPSKIAIDYWRALHVVCTSWSA